MTMVEMSISANSNIIPHHILCSVVKERGGRGGGKRGSWDQLDRC